MVPDEVVFVPRMLARFISEHRISEMLFTPSLLQGVLNSEDRDVLRSQLSSLRIVLLNGEVVPVSLLKQTLDTLPSSARVFNTYSISETHDVCTIDLTDLLPGRNGHLPGRLRDGQGEDPREAGGAVRGRPRRAAASCSSAAQASPAATSADPTWMPQASLPSKASSTTPPVTSPRWKRTA